jgi:hypothetical protein
MQKPRKHLLLRLTPEQRAAVKKFAGKDAEALELKVEELEDRVAPSRVLRVAKIDTVPLPD